MVEEAIARDGIVALFKEAQFDLAAAYRGILLSCRTLSGLQLSGPHAPARAWPRTTGLRRRASGVR
jgi:hypothetical protein